MNILGFYSGHDASYAILNNGIPIIHNELERFNRNKGAFGDGHGFFKAIHENEKIDYVTSAYRWDTQNMEPPNLKVPYKIICHHKAHASNAYYSSPYNEAFIISIDGGGFSEIGDNIQNSAFSAWVGRDNKLTNVETIPEPQFNIGALWHMYTTEVFDQGRGTEGTVMALACLGSPKYYKEILQALKEGGSNSSAKFFKPLAATEQGKWDIAASLQKVTEDAFKEKLEMYSRKYNIKNLCLTGGVSLNCALTGKIKGWFPEIEDIFCDPVPYDGGLSIGAARYAWHHVLGNPKINSVTNRTPYLGKIYGQKETEDAIEKFKGRITPLKCTQDEVIQLLEQQKIISIFGGASESGRRALGNRSIIADPRHKEIKDLINSKVKHRQSFRPFAPSILREDVEDWFEQDIDSPYMSFAIKFKQDMVDKVPAVVHFDGTGRLQTVSRDYNSWYYDFIKKWKNKTGVPILLNTSFNDREPIVETPEDGINCFLKTDINYLYFRDSDYILHKT